MTYSKFQCYWRMSLIDDRLNVPLDFLPLSIRNPNAEDRVRRPRAPLLNLSPSAHLPPGADPPGERAGAHNQVVDGVAAEGGTPDRSYLDPSQIEMLFLSVSCSHTACSHSQWTYFLN